MAVYMNAKGTTNTSFQVGKRGNKIFGGTNTPTSADVNTGDLWLDKNNGLVKIADVSGNTVTWANIIVSGSDVSLDDLTVSGNLTVQGTTTTINTQTLNVEDNIITLNSNFSGADNIVDAGIEVERGDETNVSFLWDESEGEWTLGVETLRAGDFIGTVHGNVVGSISPNGSPNTLTGNVINGGNITATGNLIVTGATIVGANLSVSEFAVSAFDATGDAWSDDDSTFATTAAIADRIDAQITSSADIVHITGTETITGDKTISGATLTLTANSTLDVSNATVTGANTDSVSEGSSNLYFTNPRARQALQVSDDSGQLSYSNGTGIFSFTNNRLALSGGTMSGNIDMGNNSISNVSSLTVSSITYPIADGSADQVLTTDGNGTLSFTTVNANPDGSNTQVQFNNAGSFGASTGFTFDDSDDTLSTGITRSISFEQFTDYDVIANSSAIGSDLGSITTGVGATIDQGLLVVDYGYPILPSVEVANLPSGQPAGTFVFCPDETGGATIVVFDGTNWRRPSDNGIAS